MRSLLPLGLLMISSLVLALYSAIDQSSNEDELVLRLKIESIEAVKAKIEAIEVALKDNWVEYRDDKKSANFAADLRKGREYLGKVARIAARQIIGKAEALSLDDYGLGAQEAGEFEVVAKGKSHVFKVGRKSFQSAERYFLEEESGMIFLAKHDFFINLIEASRNLKKVNLMPEAVDLASIEIMRGSQKVQLLSTHESKDQLLWKKNGETKVSEIFEQWLDQFFALKIKKHHIEQPELEGLTLVFEVAASWQPEKMDKENFSYRIFSEESGSEGTRYWAESVVDGFWFQLNDPQISKILKNFNDIPLD